MSVLLLFHGLLIHFYNQLVLLVLSAGGRQCFSVNWRAAWQYSCWASWCEGKIVWGYLRLLSQIRLPYIKLNIVRAIAGLILRSPISPFMPDLQRYCDGVDGWRPYWDARGSDMLSQVHRCRKDNCAVGSTTEDRRVNFAAITTNREPGSSLYRW